MTDQQPRTTGTATSRAGLIRKASRKPTKARIALSGPSGSGKTWTGLSIARVLSPTGRIVFIDSEPSDDRNTAAELYADEFDFDLIDWREPPYDPRDLALTIQELGQSGAVDVCIVDSGSPFWRGEGGTLSIAGGNFNKWQTATPAQNGLVEAILKAPMHMIFCMRVKQDFQVEQDSNGRQSVVKLGLAPIQRDDLEYEFQVIATLDMNHQIEIGKTRCQPLAGKSWVAGKQGEFAEIYREWIEKGGDLILQIDSDLIVESFGAIPENDRGPMKKRFAREVGRPDQLENPQLGAAWAWLSANLDVDPHAFVAPDDGDACSTCGLAERAGWHAENLPAGSPPESDTASHADASEAAAPPVEESSTGPTGAQETPQSADEFEVGDAKAPIDPPSPATSGDTGQSAAEAEAPRAPDPSGPFNGDTGHCDKCGAGIWYAISERDGGPGWLHAEESDRLACPTSSDSALEVAPAAPGVDVDLLYAKTHPAGAATEAVAAALEATIIAEVDLMTAFQINEAARAAGVSTSGSPKTLRKRWLDHRLKTELANA